MAILSGYKTYLAAVGLAALAVYQLSVGDVPKAVETVLAALAAAGLRSALARTPAAGTAAVTMLAVALLLSPAAVADEGKTVPAPAVEGGQVRLVSRDQLKASPAAKRATLPRVLAAGETPLAPPVAPPAAWDFSKAHTVPFPMWANNRYGNCYYTAVCKLFVALTANVSGTPCSFDLGQLVGRYLQLSGGDNGLDDSRVFPELRRGVIGPSGPHKVLDILVVDPRDVRLVATTALFGPHVWTASLPDAWLANVRPGARWDAAPPNSQNGHAMLVSGKNPDGTFNSETWGLAPPVVVTQAGVNAADSEFVSCFSLEWFDAKTGYAPNGHHYTVLAPLWESIGGSKLPASPFPPPAPTPAPVPTPGTKIELKPGDTVPDGVTITIQIAPAPLPRPMPPPPAEPPAPKSPTDAERYETVLTLVRAGKPVVIAVGVPAPAEYTQRAEFPAGFKGIAAGVYDCFLSNGSPHMLRRPDGTPMPQRLTPPAAFSLFLGGCPGGRCGVPPIGCPGGQCGRPFGF